jgi:heat shock protein HslJ
MTKVRLVMTLLAAGVVGGCDGGTTASSLRAQLTGRSFVSESVDGWQLVAGTQVNVSFDTTGVAAQAGCNSLFGTCEIEGVTLRVSMLGSTALGCDAPLLAQDDWLSAFLLAGPTLALDDPRLVMTTADAQLHLLDRKIAIPDRPLVGTPWLGNGFSDGMADTFGPGSGSVTLSFAGDGDVAVDTSCQSGAGSFTASAAAITFGALTYDGAPCADPTFQKTSDQVLLVLDGSPVTYTISETALTVTNGNNALLFRAGP